MRTGSKCLVDGMLGTYQHLWDPPSDKICFCRIGEIGATCNESSWSPCNESPSGEPGMARQGGLCQVLPDKRYGECLVQRAPNVCNCTYGLGEAAQVEVA